MTSKEFKRIRIKLHQTQKSMGLALGGYPAGTVSAWEIGARNVPKAVGKLMKMLESTVGG